MTITMTIPFGVSAALGDPSQYSSINGGRLARDRNAQGRRAEPGPRRWFAEAAFQPPACGDSVRLLCRGPKATDARHALPTVAARCGTILR